MQLVSRLAAMTLVSLIVFTLTIDAADKPACSSDCWLGDCVDGYATGCTEAACKALLHIDCRCTSPPVCQVA